jgi:hypothetical protein
MCSTLFVVCGVPRIPGWIVEKNGVSASQGRFRETIILTEFRYAMWDQLIRMREFGEPTPAFIVPE